MRQRGQHLWFRPGQFWVVYPRSHPSLHPPTIKLERHIDLSIAKVLSSPATKCRNWYELPNVIRGPMTPSSIILVRPDRETTRVFLNEVNDVDISGPAITHETCSRRDSLSWNSWKRSRVHSCASSRSPSIWNVGLFKLGVLASMRCTSFPHFMILGSGSPYVNERPVERPISVISSTCFASSARLPCSAHKGQIVRSSSNSCGTVEWLTMSSRLHFVCYGSS